MTPNPGPSSSSGRFVELVEVVPFAKPGHAACREHHGYLIALEKVAVRSRVEIRRQPKPCACALKRFMRAHKDHVFDKAGTLTWLPQHEPKRTVVVEDTTAPPSTEPQPQPTAA